VFICGQIIRIKTAKVRRGETRLGGETVRIPADQVAAATATRDVRLRVDFGAGPGDLCPLAKAFGVDSGKT
jgi:hypothetical protein